MEADIPVRPESLPLPRQTGGSAYPKPLIISFGPLLGWQLHCHPGVRQYNCRTNEPVVFRLADHYPKPLIISFGRKCRWSKLF